MFTSHAGRGHAVSARACPRPHEKARFTRSGCHLRAPLLTPFAYRDRAHVQVLVGGCAPSYRRRYGKLQGSRRRSVESESVESESVECRVRRRSVEFPRQRMRTSVKFSLVTSQRIRRSVEFSLVTRQRVWARWGKCSAHARAGPIYTFLKLLEHQKPRTVCQHKPRK